MGIESEIQGIGHSSKRGYQQVTIFSYSSKGLPGIDIVGPSKFSRLVKEKIVYLCKKEKIKIPLKRYVFCLDCPDQISGDKDCDFFNWLELPIFLLFWNLIDLIPLHNLQDCIAMGKVSIEGLITLGIPTETVLESIIQKQRDFGKGPLKLLNYKEGHSLEGLYLLPLSEIISAINGFKLIEVVPERSLNREHFG